MTPSKQPSRRIALAVAGALVAAALPGLFAGRTPPPRAATVAAGDPAATRAGDLAGANPVAMTESDVHGGRTPNRLIREKSPYLLQHAFNPVDWHPWGEEAFEKARREDKPIFLSIGYSTCHWCHVMERESFENDSVAALLDGWFVSIKVDREERPDIDRLYMTAMQAMGLGGGWPLTVFLTPDLEPFFGGTYFPPDSRFGRPGMMQLLPRIHEVWTTQRDQVKRQGAHVLEAIASATAPTGDPGAASFDSLMEGCYRGLAAAFDPEHGGFGTAPKFPSIANLNFLTRYAARDPERRARSLEMALAQLDAMRAGGIHDHLGGGFHRYATDRAWLVPHFEKMLYDQAQIAWAYLDAYQITGRPEYAATARDVFDYVTRDLTAPEGAFYSAEDADSEGEEGKFYVWTPAEVESVLGPDARLFACRYGVTAEGNFEHGTTILHEARTLAEAAREVGIEAAEAEQRLALARAKLLERRSQRVRPHLDDKVLVAWNGIMISAFARGARVLDDPALAQRAERAARFLWERQRDDRTGEIRRRFRDGESAGAGQLDDYAYLALGLIDLYGATFDPVWLERAGNVTQAMLDRFWDEKAGGFFESPAGDPHLAIRMKDDFDGAEMAGNSVAGFVVQTLAALLDRSEWRERAARLFEYYSVRLAPAPAAMPQMLVAMDLARTSPHHVVIAGRRDAPDTRALVREFERRFLPRDVLLVARGGEEQRRLAALAPFVGALTAREGRATGYVCVDYACRLPVADPAAFAAQLDQMQDSTREGKSK